MDNNVIAMGEGCLLRREVRWAKEAKGTHESGSIVES